MRMGRAAARPLMAATNSWGLLDVPAANGAAGFQGPDWQRPDWKNQGVLNLAHSPYAKLRNVPVRAVTIEDGFWAKRRTTNVESSIPSMHGELLEHRVAVIEVSADHQVSAVKLAGDQPAVIPPLGQSSRRALSHARQGAGHPCHRVDPHQAATCIPPS